MGRRVYGQAQESKPVTGSEVKPSSEVTAETKVISDEELKEIFENTEPGLTEPVTDDIVEETPEPVMVPPEEAKSKGRMGAFIIVAVFMILILTAAVMFVYIKVFDGNKGASSSSGLAVKYITAISNSDTNAIYDCIPPDYRNMNINQSQATELSHILSLQKENPLSLSNIRVVKEVSCFDKKDALLKGLVNAYGKTPSKGIDDIRMVTVSADVNYNGKVTNYNFQILTMKIGFKWYIYLADPVQEAKESTGSTTETSIEPPVGAMTDPSSSETSETSAAATPTPGPTPTPAVTLAPYDELWLKNLKAGMFSLGGVELTMPIRMTAEDGTDEVSFAELLQLDSSKISQSSMTLAPNQIVSGTNGSSVPVYMNNKDWLMITDFWVIHIGNLTKNEIALDQGHVTKLYMEKSDVYPYPQLILPGGITFGSTIDEVRAVYGSIDLYEPSGNSEVYTRDGVAYKDDTDLPKYPMKETPADGLTIYRVSLQNRFSVGADGKWDVTKDLNSLYLEFDRDGKLVAVEWFYFDIGAVK